MDRDHLRAWIDGYERHWRTPGTAGLAELFAEDVVYSMGPYEEPIRGLSALAALWERERESPEENFDLSSEIVAIERSTAVARIEVHYGPPRTQEYRDLWVMRFAVDGRCTSFEEWPFWPGLPLIGLR